MSKRVIFTFDQKSYATLKTLAGDGSLASAVRDSLYLMRALQQQEQQGFTELIVRNPRTNEERVMVRP
jgi:hypothetical protein